MPTMVNPNAISSLWPSAMPGSAGSPAPNAFQPGATTGPALYFSRNLIPSGPGDHYHHIGIYAFRRAALRTDRALLEDEREVVRLRAVLAAFEELQRALVGVVALLEARGGERLERELHVREVGALLVAVAVAAVDRKSVV